MMETETAETECIADTTTVNTEIKEKTSSTEVFNQSGMQKADRLQSTAQQAQRVQTFIRCSTNNIQEMTEKSL